MAELQEIPVEMIILPDEIMRRETMQESIESLIEDIAARGLIQPIGVTQIADGRYRIRWGARRTLAHRMMARTTISAFVHHEGEADETDDMARENYQRVQISDGEDVRFITRYMTEKGVSAAECARRLRLPYPRVLRAEAIAGGHEAVRDALYAGQITAAVAMELVQVQSHLYITNMLYHAIHTQCSAKYIRSWREMNEAQGMELGVEQVETMIAAQSQVNFSNSLRCEVCLQYFEYGQAAVRGSCNTCWGALMELKEQAVLHSQQEEQTYHGTHDYESQQAAVVPIDQELC